MRWTKKKLIGLKLVLWLFTFGLVLPLMAQKWVFSPFFHNSNDFRSRASKFVDKMNAERYNQTNDYLQKINPEINKNLHTTNLVNAEIVAVIITKKREICSYRGFDCEPHYLQQVIAALDEDSKSFASSRREGIVPIVICNVDKNSQEQLDFTHISGHFPVILRYTNESSNNKSYSSRTQESLDYAFCLESILKLSSPKYLLVLEDDAMSFKGIFEKIFYILENNIEQKMLRGNLAKTDRWGWIKLYYPELWAGFGFEERKIIELVTIATFGAGVFYLIVLVLIKPKPQLSFIFLFSFTGAVYLLVLVLVTTRQTLLEMRRLHSFFFQISPDLGCCTPAVLYSTKWIPEIVQYLQSSQCRRCHLGVDLALNDFREQINLPCYLIEPSLVRHIGMHSTLTSNKDPRSFIFHDFMYTEISNLIVGL